MASAASTSMGAISKNEATTSTLDSPLLDPTADPTCPFQIHSSPELGRHLLASRDLQAGEVILEEAPLVTGPQRGSPPLCLGCYGPVDGSCSCPKCGWLMCSPECILSPDHSAECHFTSLSGRKVAVEEEEEERSSQIYECIILLRCLRLKQTQPDKWAHILSMESHMASRRTTDLFAHSQLLIFILQSIFGITEEDFPEEELHTVAAVLDVNSYEIRMPTHNIQGLYPFSSLPEHNCVANTHRVVKSDYTMVMRAAALIKKGEHIKVTYTDPMWPTRDRRAHLLYSKHFECNCQRCLDPSELGSFLGALHCPVCFEASLLPSDPTQPESDWHCSQCQETVPHQYASKLEQDCSEALQELEEEEESAEDPAAYEAFLQRFSGLLHPTHAHLIDAKSTLLQLYGSVDGHSMDELAPEALARKEQLCRELLGVCSLLLPGISRFRGTIMYELAKSLVQKAQNQHQEGKESMKGMKALTDEAERALMDTIHILQYEPDYQPEGELVKQAEENLRAFQEWSHTSV